LKWQKEETKNIKLPRANETLCLLDNSNEKRDENFHHLRMPSNDILKQTNCTSKQSKQSKQPTNNRSSFKKRRSNFLSAIISTFIGNFFCGINLHSIKSKEAAAAGNKLFHS